MTLPNSAVDSKMGCSRGTPIDRYYIEKFLEENKEKIHGDVMEIGDNNYSLRYGSNINHSYIFTVGEPISKNVIVGDLTTGVGCVTNSVDCFILTQTLPFIFDINSAAKNIIMMLKPGGTALVTVGGISQISPYDYPRWGHYWSFTDLSLKKLFEQYTHSENISINTYGNPKIATAFIYGLCQEDIDYDELEWHDTSTQVIITAVITKDSE